ncbi:hypothetical protein N0V90_011383 [Kalmusia sp. IMI 367209]|nr:hypothetical protein N0V90_011383 [Kalmusia sp. IMI 367209]
MGLYQRRRPSPIHTLPTRVRRQEPESSSDVASSPDSPDTPGPDSPDSPEIPGAPESPASPTSTGLPAPTQLEASSSLPPPPPPTETPAPSQISSAASSTATAQASASSSELPPPPPPPPPPSSTAQEESSSSSSSEATSLVPSALPVLSTPAQNISSEPTRTPQTTIQGTAIIVTSTPESSSPASTSTLTFSTPRRPVSEPKETTTPSPSSETQISTTGTAFVPAQSELDGERSGIGREPHRKGEQEKPIISKGAEAAAITLSVMGFIALLVGAFVFFKRRRRRVNESSLRHAEDAFSPNNNGSLHAPETAHIYDSFGSQPGLAHITKSSTNSTSLFGGSHYQRPETVSTNSNPSRLAPPAIAPPQPTPNPFADPPRNKAYDQLRGRPRSTTLTDRGSWLGNPFKDPASERFDPFGELHEKAREERRKYMAEARREAEDMRQREAEQEYLEKERMGLGVPGRDDRKGSNATVSGLGVLDRSGDGRFR